MSHIYITEYSRVSNAFALAPVEPANAEQYLEIDFKPTQSKPFKDDTRFIAVNTDTACSIAIGKDAIADNEFKRLSAGETRYFGVDPGHRISVVLND